MVLTISKVEEMGKYVVFVEAELIQSAADDALPVVRLFGSGCGEKIGPLQPFEPRYQFTRSNQQAFF
jgi:hypothetical protein